MLDLIVSGERGKELALNAGHADEIAETDCRAASRIPTASTPGVHS
jgi:hypothetical protein